MGEVYRARDTRLDRSVAIKILSAELAANQAFKLRFEREAKTISSLSHPHICALYDVGETNSRAYLVMEYLEGESLADRLVRGPLPIDQALRLGIEIASALDSAHRQGVVHRDLKPGNIMITKSGAKLLDFGLARTTAVIPSGESGSETNAPTHARPLTDQGTILGTFQYMAPEQLEGKPADPRTDIFALGAVLYEAVTGVRAFEGKSRASLIAAILEHEPPPMSVARPVTPASLDRVVRACLGKDPAERVQTAHDLMLDLTWIRESSSQGEGLAVAAIRRRRRWVVPAIAGLLAGITAALVTLSLRDRRAPMEPATFSVLAGAEALEGRGMAISPDGRALAWVGALSGADRLLWIRRFDDPEPRSIPATDGAQWPFWSPDGQWIAFFAKGGKLKKVNVSTGSVQEICNGHYGVGGAWSRNGTIVFARRFNEGLYRVPAGGGDPVPLTRLDPARHESVHAWPHFLSDGIHLIFLNRTTAEERNQIAVVSSEGGSPKLLLKADALVGFDRPWFFYVRENILYAQQLDEKALELKGDPVEIADQVTYRETWAASGATVSPAGVIAYEPLFMPPTEVRVYDRKGAVVRTLLADNGITEPQFSPDGRKLAFSKTDPKKGADDIWVVDSARGVRTRLTGGLSHNDRAAWSPDGTRIAFISDRAGMFDIYTQGIDDQTPPAMVWKSERDKESPQWMPDGQSMIVVMDDPETNSDLYVLAANGGSPRALMVRESNQDSPAISPDGRWVAFHSSRSGSPEIYAMPISGGRITQLSTNGGAYAAWSRNGSELFYQATDRTLMSVPIRISGNEIDPSVPRPLFILPRTTSDRPFSPTPDGNFLIAVASDRGTPHISVILGWKAKL